MEDSFLFLILLPGQQDSCVKGERDTVRAQNTHGTGDVRTSVSSLQLFSGQEGGFYTSILQDNINGC